VEGGAHDGVWGRGFARRRLDLNHAPRSRDPISAGSTPDQLLAFVPSLSIRLALWLSSRQIVSTMQRRSKGSRDQPPTGNEAPAENDATGFEALKRMLPKAAEFVPKRAVKK